MLFFPLIFIQNSSFSISWLPLKGITNIIKSPLSMLTMVKTCTGDKQDPDLYKSSSSYVIFLCILAKVIKKAMKNSGPHPWKQVKGRYVLYSIFFVISVHWYIWKFCYLYIYCQSLCTFKMYSLSQDANIFFWPFCYNEEQTILILTINCTINCNVS